MLLLVLNQGSLSRLGPKWEVLQWWHPGIRLQSTKVQPALREEEEDAEISSDLTTPGLESERLCHSPEVEV